MGIKRNLNARFIATILYGYSVREIMNPNALLMACAKDATLYVRY